MGDVENGLQDAGRVFNESAYNVLFKSGRTVSVWTMDWEDLLTICEGINKRENEFVDVLLRVEGGDWQARIVGEDGYVFVSVDNVRM